MSAVVFIDANMYLYLYGLGNGKRLLDLIEKQKKHLFVSAQVADEVRRNKLEYASNALNVLSDIDASIPGHLLGISDEEIKKVRVALKDAKNAKQRLKEHAAEAMRKISRSEDDVSKRLEALFNNSFKPSEAELVRARKRKEIGNPPGKPDNPLGDEITWEQLLTYCEKHKCKQLWIITNDHDYFTSIYGDQFLNSFLYSDLTKACGAGVEVHCFDKLLVGIKDFDKRAGANVAENTLTKSEEIEIAEALTALPTPGSLMTTDSPNEPKFEVHIGPSGTSVLVVHLPGRRIAPPGTAVKVAPDLVLRRQATKQSK
jgi:hypothetical protein